MFRCNCTILDDGFAGGEGQLRVVRDGRPHIIAEHNRPGLAFTTQSGLAAGIMGLTIPAALPALPPAPEVFAFPLNILLPITVILVSYAAAVGLGIILKERDLNHGARGHLVPLAGPSQTTMLRTGTDG